MSKEMPHVVQARNELANAEAYGQLDRARAAEKVLAAAGVRRRVAASGDEDDARRTPPAARTAPPRQTTAADDPDGTTKQIREWAAKAGLTVSARGRIPDEVVAAYHRAHKEK
jgi:hypothetical protein